MSGRLPAPDGARIRDTVPTVDEVVVVPSGAAMLRIHPLGGPHPVAWNTFRHWGPTASRFDHHTRPLRRHPTRGVMYLTAGDQAWTTALAECFQDGAGRVGPIDRRARAPAVTVIGLSRDLRLLDLGSGWVARAGGNQSITSGLRSTARAWARSIYRHHPHLDGVWYPSSIWGPGTCVTLWERAADAIAPTPVLHRLLSDPVLDPPLASAAETLGTYLVP